MYCRYCGKAIDYDSIYCKYCGERVKIFNNIPRIKDEDFTVKAVKEDRYGDVLMDKYGALYSSDGRQLLDFENDEITHYTIRHGTEIISHFGRCPKLIELIIPDSVITIGLYAFCNWSSSVIERIVIGNNVTTIEEGAFHGPSSENFEELIIPISVREIGGWAFCGFNMRRLTIGENVTLIDQYAFAACNLRELIFNCKECSINFGAFEHNYIHRIVFGKHVSVIPENLIIRGANLMYIHSLNPKPPKVQGDFFLSNKNDTTKLWVPKGSKEAYASAEGWKNFRIINILERY